MQRPPESIHGDRSFINFGVSRNVRVSVKLRDAEFAVKTSGFVECKWIDSYPEIIVELFG